VGCNVRKYTCRTPFILLENSAKSFEVGFEVLTVVVVDVMPFSPVKVKQVRAGFCFGVFFDTEDGVDMFIQNIC
jgi:hypothetical protein